MSTNSRERKCTREFYRGFTAGFENRKQQVTGDSMSWKSAVYKDGRERGTMERLTRKVAR